MWIVYTEVYDKRWFYSAFTNKKHAEEIAFQIGGRVCSKEECSLLNIINCPGYLQAHK